MLLVCSLNVMMFAYFDLVHPSSALSLLETKLEILSKIMFLPYICPHHIDQEDASMERYLCIDALMTTSEKLPTIHTLPDIVFSDYIYTSIISRLSHDNQ
jgi:hypothetical protein